MSDRQNLLAGQRRAVILDEVRRTGGVRVSELTGLLGVSDMTVRRDLDVLARRGELRKVHGGAVPVADVRGHEPGFAAKEPQAAEAKRRIAVAAETFTPHGGVVGFSGGTTVREVARRLVDVPGLTVVTNSVRVAEVFPVTVPPDPAGGVADGPTTVVLTGGVRTPSDALVGPVADAAIASLHLDVLFLGAHGMSPEDGLTTPNLAEAETNRRLIRAARRVVVTADHSKWEVTGLRTFAALDEVGVFVTDVAPDSGAAEALASAGTDVVVAG